MSGRDEPPFITRQENEGPIARDQFISNGINRLTGKIDIKDSQIEPCFSRYDSQCLGNRGGRVYDLKAILPHFLGDIRRDKRIIFNEEHPPWQSGGRAFHSLLLS